MKSRYKSPLANEGASEILATGVSRFNLGSPVWFALVLLVKPSP